MAGYNGHDIGVRDNGKLDIRSDVIKRAYESCSPEIRARIEELYPRVDIEVSELVGRGKGADRVVLNLLESDPNVNHGNFSLRPTSRVMKYILLKERLPPEKRDLANRYTAA